MSSMPFNLFDQRLCLRLTETLLHFLWQGVAIGLLTLCLAWLCRTASSRIRYGIHAVSLVLMAVCVPITFFVIGSPQLPREDSASSVVVAPLMPSLATPSVAAAGFGQKEATIESIQQFPVLGGTLSDVPIVEKVVVETNLIRPTLVSQLESLVRRYAPYTACAYFLGVILMMVRLSTALWGGHRLRRSAIPVSDRTLLRQIRIQASKIGLKCAPVVAYCGRIAIPVVAGVLRPMILLPIWLATEMDPEQVLVILTHEMAHIRRSDLLVNLLQRLLETVLFFHPVVWYVSRQLSFERENCCDDAVVAAGYESVQYASTLVRMAELCASNRRPIPTTLLALAASGSSGSELKRRIVRLLSDPQRLRLTRGDSLTLLLLIGLIVGTMAGFWRQTFAAPVNNVDAKTAEGNPAKADDSNEVEFVGKVVDTDGKPLVGAEIWFAPPDRHHLLNVSETQTTLRKITMSDSEGKFSFRLEPVKVQHCDPEDWRHMSRVIAKAPGYGVDWLSLVAFEKYPVRTEMRDSLSKTIDARLGPGRFESQTLRLPREAGPVQGRIIDLEGNPVAGVTVSVEEIQNPDLEILNRAFEQSSSDLRYQSLHAKWIPWGYLDRNNWQILIPSVTTNSRGEFSLTGLGREQMATVTLSGERVAADKFFIVAQEMETKSVPHTFDPHGAKDVFVGLHFNYAVGPAIPVSGVVSEFRTGKPIANAEVYVERLFREEGMKSGSQLRFARHIRTVTDDQGRYQLVGIPPGKKHVLNVVPQKSEPWLIAEHEFSLESGQSAAIVDIKVLRGIWLEGQVTDEATGRPIKGQVDYLALQSNPNIPKQFGLSDGWQMGRFPIDETGHYRVAGLPGPGVLFVQSREKTVYPRSVGAEKVPGYEADSDFLPTTPTGMPLSNWNRLQYIDPAVDATPRTLDLTLSAGPSLVGRIVGPNDSPVSNLEALGANENGGFWEKLMDDKFTIYNYLPTVSRDLFFKTADNSLVGHLHVEGTPPENLTVRLQPAVTVRGRLIETEFDDVAVSYGIYSASSKLGKWRTDQAITDTKGRFEIKGMLAGNVYEMHSFNQRHFGSGKNNFKVDLTNAKPGDVIELGDVTGKNAKSEK